MAVMITAHEWHQRVRNHAESLYRHLGLVPLYINEQSKAPYGRKHRELVKNPPSLEEVKNFDYSGGLAILPGTPHFAGGYVVAVDIDHGGLDWPRVPDWIYVERGTTNRKWHIFCRTVDQLEGQIDLKYIVDGEEHQVAEIKGAGITALRSWPTIPPNKPRGYAVHTHILRTKGKISGAPSLTSEKLSTTLAEMLSKDLNKTVIVGTAVKRNKGEYIPVDRGVFDQKITIEGFLRKHLRTQFKKSSGDELSTRCMLHEDRTPSFTVNTVKQLWHCFGCGQGGNIITLGRALEKEGLI